jgi:hypothetical protein
LEIQSEFGKALSTAALLLGDFFYNGKSDYVPVVVLLFKDNDDEALNSLKDGARY